MPRDHRQYLEEIIAAIDEIGAFTGELDMETFRTDLKSRFATLYALTIIGEAASKLPQEIREKKQSVEWRKIAAMRNLIVHEYFVVDADILWDIITAKLPPLRVACAEILSAME